MRLNHILLQGLPLQPPPAPPTPTLNTQDILFPRNTPSHTAGRGGQCKESRNFPAAHAASIMTRAAKYKVAEKAKMSVLVLLRSSTVVAECVSGLRVNCTLELDLMLPRDSHPPTSSCTTSCTHSFQQQRAKWKKSRGCCGTLPAALAPRGVCATILLRVTEVL